MTQTGGQVLVEVLRAHGVDRAFCVPGESFLAVLDALLDTPDIMMITCRHEGGAAMMADAAGKMTGRPGICFVSRGPGATNASAGVHVAFQDSTPLILFIGDIERSAEDREAFQELDYKQMFAPMAKWVGVIRDPRRIPELVGRAFYTATSGRPGPVVLVLPEDMLAEQVTPPWSHIPRFQAVEAGLRRADLYKIRDILAAAARPLALVGGRGWTSQTSDALARFSERWMLPVATTFRTQDHFDNEHPHYAGDVGSNINPELRRSVQSADVLLCLGARLGETTTNGYELLDVPFPRQKMIHIHPSAEELGRVYQPTLAVNAGVDAALSDLNALPPPTATPWAVYTRDMNLSYRRWTTPKPIQGSLQMGSIMEWLRTRLPRDAIVANGAGNFTIWPNRFHRYRVFPSMLAPTSGSMGYGIPAAIAAKLQFPERMVVAFTGDGDLMMTVQELTTAVQHGTAIVVVLLNNGMYGTVRMHQERHYPGRVSATALINPDFVALARSFGAHAERVSLTDGFAPAFERAVASGQLALIELLVDPHVLTPNLTIESLRAAAASTRDSSPPCRN